MHTNTIERDPEEYASATFHKCMSETNTSVAQPNNNEQFIDEASPELLHYDSDDEPESEERLKYYERVIEMQIKCIENNETENFYEQIFASQSENICENIFKDYEQVIELQIECIEKNANESSQFDPDEISSEFMKDLSNEMQIETKTPTLAEDGLGKVQKFFKLLNFL